MEPKTRRETFLNNAANGDPSLTPVTREEAFINKVAEAVASGGGLPPVTSADNGDVLTVVNGAWAKAAASGDSGNIVFDISNASRPSIDGAIIEEGKIYCSDLYPDAQNCIVADLDFDSLPLIIAGSYNDGNDPVLYYAYVSEARRHVTSSPTEVQTGSLKPCLLNNNVPCIIFDAYIVHTETAVGTAEVSSMRLWVFPTTAQFGMKQIIASQ